jgi:hypothetical protein
MCKVIGKWLAGLFVLALIAGYSPIAQAKDNQEKKSNNKETEAKAPENKEKNKNTEEKTLSVEEMLNENLAEEGLAIDDDATPEGAVTTEPENKETTDDKKTDVDKKDAKEHKKRDSDQCKREHEEALKKCRELECHVPKCIHEWSQYELKLTEEQRGRIKTVKDTINEETIGINWCTLISARHKLENLLKDKKSFPKQIESAKAEVKRIKEGMQAGYKKFNDTYHNLILSAEQRILLEERNRAIKEHQAKCKPQHNQHCPFYHKENNRPGHDFNEGNFIKYCNDEKHLSEGLFECPRNYNEIRKDAFKEQDKK